MWITFYNNKLWWGKAKKKINTLKDKTRTKIRTREIIGGWKDSDKNGKKLMVDNLRGSLTKVQGFRGTICWVYEKDYLLNKINGKLSKEIIKAYNAYDKLKDTLSKLIKSLNWKEFEVLIDLIFRQAGWQRNSIIGRSTKFLDLSLFQPMTSEKALVQIKSQSDFKEFESYYSRFKRMKEYDEFFFVVHSTTDEKFNNFQSEKNIKILLIDDISKMVIDLGLINWVISKSS